MSETVNPPRLRPYQPIYLRLWHWLNALTIFGLLGTFFLRKTFLNFRTNSDIITAKATEGGVTLSADLAKTIARSLRDEMWSWHYPLGFVLCFLFFSRVVMILKTGRCPRKDAWNSWKIFFKSNSPAKETAREVALARTGQVVFYISTLVMCVTGLLMYFSEKLGISKSLNHSIQEVHETVMWVIPIFIAAHVAGLIRAELTHHRGIVSDMINGGNP